jgi:hypothetical protein
MITDPMAGRASAAMVRAVLMTLMAMWVNTDTRIDPRPADGEAEGRRIADITAATAVTLANVARGTDVSRAG